MDCFEAEILMLKELEGIATDSETDRLIHHMLGCPDCVRHFKFLKSVVEEGFQPAERSPVPQDFDVKVMTKIRNINAITVVSTKVRKIR